MVEDIRIKPGFFSHPKLKRLKRLLGRPLDDWSPAIALQRLWCFVAENHPLGDLSGMDELAIADAAEWPEDPVPFVRALEEARWIDVDDQGERSIHDWSEHQPYVVQRPQRQEAARKAASERWKKKRRADAKEQEQLFPENDADRMRPACEAHGKPMRRARFLDAPSPVPVPVPAPDPDPDPVPVGNSPTKLIEEMQYGHGGFFQGCLGPGKRDWVESYLLQFPVEQIKSAMASMPGYYRKQGIPPPARDRARLKVWEWTEREGQKQQPQGEFDAAKERARKRIFGDAAK